MRVLISLLISLLFATTAIAASKGGGVTQMTYSPGHGTQVEYLANDGTNYLWYPGNRVVLPGHWMKDNGAICFRYGGNTYNPVTGQEGGGWECMPYKLHLSGIVEKVDGDVFGLASRTSVPFSLPKGRTTIAALAKRVKGASLPTVQPETPGNPNSPIGSCKELVANQNKSKRAMVLAASLYFHGQLMGKPCVKVDYVRAFALLEAAGDKGTARQYIRILQERAATGNPRAISALKAIGVK